MICPKALKVLGLYFHMLQNFMTFSAHFKI